MVFPLAVLHYARHKSVLGRARKSLKSIARSAIYQLNVEGDTDPATPGILKINYAYQKY